VRAGRAPVLTSRRPVGSVRPLDAYPAVTAEVVPAEVAERVELDGTERTS